MTPAPTPLKTPQNKFNCHSSVIAAPVRVLPPIKARPASVTFSGRDDPSANRLPGRRVRR